MTSTTSTPLPGTRQRKSISPASRRRWSAMSKEWRTVHGGGVGRRGRAGLSGRTADAAASASKTACSPPLCVLSAMVGGIRRMRLDVRRRPRDILYRAVRGAPGWVSRESHDFAPIVAAATASTRPPRGAQCRTGSSARPARICCSTPRTPWTGTRGVPRRSRRRADEDKPVFLSVGYSACHWCHVMEHESFEDEATAAVMNAHFVSVKVDREERPDVDAIYMDAVQALTGTGGWPMSVFLTPDGAPFFGGTYFPDEPRYGMPSFTERARRIAGLWEDAPRASSSTARGWPAGRPTRRCPRRRSRSRSTARRSLGRPAQLVADRSTATHGGCGGAPKFPQPTASSSCCGATWRRVTRRCWRW